MLDHTQQAKNCSIKLINDIKQQINDAGGTISFAKFMRAALYAEQCGYYNNIFGKKFGRDGDFITAPTLGVLFASCVAHKCRSIFAATEVDGNILEIGAGDGQLAVQLIDHLKVKQNNHQYRLKNYFILETSKLLQQRQHSLLQHHLSFGDKVACKHKLNIFWVNQVPKNFTGIIIANEVLDAIPVHLFRIRNHEIYEKVVTVAGNDLALVEVNPTKQFREAIMQLPINIAWENYQSEICLLMPDFIKSLAVNLQRGAILLYDYGCLADEYYHQARSNGTLRCYYKHILNDNPFYWPGLQDITAHVNFSTVINAGITCGLQVMEYSSLGHFLINNNITENVNALLHRTNQINRYRIQQEFTTLISPVEMGEIFKFLYFSK